MFALQQRFELKTQREFDRFAGGACRSNNDDPSGRRLSCEECLGIGGEKVIAGDSHCWNIESGYKKIPLSGSWRGEWDVSLPTVIVAVPVVAMRPHDDDTRFAIVTRLDDDHWGGAVIRAVLIVVRGGEEIV